MRYLIAAAALALLAVPAQADTAVRVPPEFSTAPDMDQAAPQLIVDQLTGAITYCYRSDTGTLETLKITGSCILIGRVSVGPGKNSLVASNPVVLPLSDGGAVLSSAITNVDTGKVTQCDYTYVTVIRTSSHFLFLCADIGTAAK